MRNVFIMATPVEEGAPIIGSASEVCVELWGTVPSGYPRYICKALSVARDCGKYRGYTLAVLKDRPTVLPPVSCSRASLRDASKWRL